MFKASYISPWIVRTWDLLESMPTECPTRIRPSNPDTAPSTPTTAAAVLPSSWPGRRWMLAHVGALNSCQNKDTRCATCTREVPLSDRSSQIYSNTLTETPSLLASLGRLKTRLLDCVYEGVMLLCDCGLCCYSSSLTVDPSSANRLVDTRPYRLQDIWSTQQRIVTKLDCQKDKYTYIYKYIKLRVLRSESSCI